MDTSGVRGVDPDLRVRPFFLHGETMSIREFVVGAFNAEMGLEAPDPDMAAARAGKRVVTPSGMVLDGSKDKIEAPPAASPSDDPDRDGVTNEIPVSLIDHMEFYLLNYFKAGTYEQTRDVQDGRRTFDRIGCTSCHIADLTRRPRPPGSRRRDGVQSLTTASSTICSRRRRRVSWKPTTTGASRR